MHSKSQLHLQHYQFNLPHMLCIAFRYTRITALPFAKELVRYSIWLHQHLHTKKPAIRINELPSSSRCSPIQIFMQQAGIIIITLIRFISIIIIQRKHVCMYGCVCVSLDVYHLFILLVQTISLAFPACCLQHFHWSHWFTATTSTIILSAQLSRSLRNGVG